MAGTGKTDMERVGLFKEMSYHTIGDKYRSKNQTSFNDAASKGKQILPGGSKTKSALSAGYFHDKFNRVMEGEAYSDPVKFRRQWRLKEAQKNIGKAFLPSNGEKMPSGIGSHYGTFSGTVGAFSPSVKPAKSSKAPGRNFTTNPPKKGTGFGYVSVTLGNYPKYNSDAYDRARDSSKKENEQHKSLMKGGSFKLNMHPRQYFDANPYQTDKPLPPLKRTGSAKRDVKPFKPSSPPKMAGGMKAGTFDPYPSHSQDPYAVKVKRSVKVVNNSGKIFMPSPGPKSAPVSSVLNQNVIRSVNVQNYKTVTTVY